MKASAVNRCVCAGFEPAGIRRPGNPEDNLPNIDFPALKFLNQDDLIQGVGHEVRI